MTSVVTSEGSPLDDYFRDEGDSAPSSSETIDRGGRRDDANDMEEGDVTLVSPNTSADLDNGHRLSSLPLDSRRKGWTGIIDSVPSSSRRASTSLPGHFDPSPPRGDDFAERFQYLICSSGLLEKDYLPGLAGSDDVPEISDVMDGVEYGPGTPVRRDTLQKLHQWRDAARHVLVMARAKWDTILAGAIILLAVAWTSGASLALWILITATISPAWTFLDKLANATVSSDNFHSGVQSALSTLLASTKHVDTTFDDCISVLSKTSNDHHALRLGLHRTTTNMVDHIATATSGLSTLVDHAQLAVLAEMYDVQLGPKSRTKPRRPDDSSDEAREDSVRSDTTLFSPSSRSRLRKRLSASLTGSSSMSLSKSSPGRLRHGHIRHLSLASSATLPRAGQSHANSPMNWTPRDRFTSLPPRTPRESRRISLDPAMWERIQLGADGEDRDENEPMSSVTDIDRIPEVDNLEGANGLHNPTSPNHRYSPFHTSPLANRSLSPPSNPTSPRFPSISAQLLPAPGSRYSLPITSTQSKRRSLQNMPYYSSDDQRSPTKSIARIRTRPSSELQELRSRSSGGLKRISTDFAAPGPSTAPVGLGLPTKSLQRSPLIRPSPRQRTTSYSPLSLSSLKGSCLNVHLKRRRLACCLLGLRFTERQPAYWDEVCEVIRSLCTATSSEVDSLREAIQVAKETNVQGPEEEHSRSPNLVPFPSPSRHDVSDFAPRQAPGELLLERVQAIQGHLATLWGEVEDVKARLQTGEEPGDKWHSMRETMREITREWEKGKTVALALESKTETDESLSPEEPAHPSSPPEEHRESDEMPEVFRAWQDETPSGDEDAPDDDTHPTANDNVILPLPGMDQVFESDLSALPVRTSQLSREERIKLVKEARAKGLNITSALRAAQNGELEILDNGKSDPDEMVKGQEVVQELKGMIGIIRKRKGLDAAAGHEVPKAAVSPDIPARREEESPLSPNGPKNVESSNPSQDPLSQPPIPRNVLFPSDDLRKAFVFPALERHPTNEA